MCPHLPFTASPLGGVTLKPVCLEPCSLSCFWGCEIWALQGALQTHQSHQRFSSSLLLEALKQRCLFSHSFQYPLCLTIMFRSVILVNRSDPSSREPSEILNLKSLRSNLKSSFKSLYVRLDCDVFLNNLKAGSFFPLVVLNWYITDDMFSFDWPGGDAYELLKVPLQ